MTPEMANAQAFVAEALTRAAAGSMLLAGVVIGLAFCALIWLAARRFDNSAKVAVLEGKIREMTAAMKSAHAALKGSQEREQAAVGGLRGVQAYFRRRKASFDDDDRKTVAESVDALLENFPLQITFQRGAEHAVEEMLPADREAA